MSNKWVVHASPVILLAKAGAIDPSEPGMSRHSRVVRVVVACG